VVGTGSGAAIVGRFVNMQQAPDSDTSRGTPIASGETSGASDRASLSAQHEWAAAGAATARALSPAPSHPGAPAP
jgi:hypothetical protein